MILYGCIELYVGSNICTDKWLFCECEWLSENLLSLKRFSKQQIKSLGKEVQVLRERNLIKSVSPSACVPQILCTCADGMHAGILLNSYLACPLASIIHTPLDEQSARFCAASIVAALEDLHQVFCQFFFPTLSLPVPECVVSLV